MSYRDDLDAAQSRADALQREVEELRAKTAELEARGARDDADRDAQERRRLLAMAELRERAEQARRDATRAELEAIEAQQAGAIVPADDRAMRLARAFERTRAHRIGGAVMSGIGMIGAMMAGQAIIALVMFGCVALLSVTLWATHRPDPD